jgi:hypothetical protein
VFNLARKDAVRLAGELFFPSGSEVKFQRRLLGIPVEKPQFWSMGEEREYYAAELMKQRPAEAYINFKGMGDDEPYAARVPHVADVTPNREKVDILRRHVAARYYRPLAVVEREIAERWAAIRSAIQPPPLGGDYRR